MILPGFGTVHPTAVRHTVADNFSRGIVGTLFALDTVHSSVYVLLFTYSVCMSLTVPSVRSMRLGKHGNSHNNQVATIGLINLAQRHQLQQPWVLCG